MSEISKIEGPTTEELWETLKQIEDPELHMSIVELGLVYDVVMDEGEVTVSAPDEE